MASAERATRTATAALLACVVVVDPGGLAPSGSARFAAVAAVLGAGALVVTWRWPDRPEAVRPFVMLWTLLLVIIALSAVASPDGWHAVFGTSERNLGLLTWIGFAVAFGLGAALPRGSEPMVATAATIAVAVMSGLALLEAVGLDPSNTAWPGRRVGTPYAQSTYLGVALVGLGPLVAGLALDRNGDQRLRGVAAVVTIAGSAALLATQSRGPLLALGFALVFVLVMRGRAMVGVVAGGATISLVVLASLIRGWGSLGGRFDEWRVGLRGVRSSPLLGFGPEGYRSEFPRLVDADYVRANGTAVITDRAHNTFIDLALSSGIAAAAVLMIVWVLVGRAAGVTVRDRDVSMPTLGLAVGVIAGFTQQLVLFPLAEIDPMIWLFAGALVGSAAPLRAEEATIGARSRGTTAWLVGVPVAAAMAASFWWNLTTALGEHQIAQSSSFRQDRAEAVANDALEMRPESIRLAYAASLVHANGPTLLDLDEAISILEQALERHPQDPPLRTDYVFRLVERARRSGLPDDAGRATDAAAAAVAQSPNSPQLIGAYAEALLLTGELRAAREQVQRALELAPDDAMLIELADLIEKS